MDPERYAIEHVFNVVCNEIKELSRKEQGPGPLSEDDQHFYDRLMYHRDLSGRSLENFLCKILELGKAELGQYMATSSSIKAPENFDRIRAGRCPREKKIEIARLL